MRIIKSTNGFDIQVDNEAVAKLYGSNAVLNKIAVCEKHEVSHLDVEQNKKYARMV